MVEGLSSSLRDLTVLGPRFWWGGVRAKLKRDGLVPVMVPGIGTVHVRARDSDMTILRQVFRDRDYELPSEVHRERMQRIYDRIVASGRTPVIVDAGANMGAASLWFAHAFPAAQIVAIEPEPNNAALLRRNVGTRATVLECALGGTPGHVSVIVGGKSDAAQTARADSGIPIVTVDQAFAKVPNGAPFVLKIDIEGFEKDLFAGDCRWLDRIPFVIVEPHDWLHPGTSRGLQTVFGSRDYDLLISGENLVYCRREPEPDATANAVHAERSILFGTPEPVRDPAPSAHG